MLWTDNIPMIAVARATDASPLPGIRIVSFFFLSTFSSLFWLSAALLQPRCCVQGKNVLV